MVIVPNFTAPGTFIDRLKPQHNIALAPHYVNFGDKSVVFSEVEPTPTAGYGDQCRVCPKILMARLEVAPVG